jgi:hypothetical protein
VHKTCTLAENRPVSAGEGLMKRLNATAVTMATAALFGWVPPAQATSITYELSGVASGKIGATTFTNVEVDLIGMGDTANVTSLLSGEVFGDPFNKFTVTIAGVGTATITDPSEIWAIPVVGGPPLTAPTVVFGRIDVPPALDSITGIGIFSSNALAGYTGASAIGPLTDAGGIGFPTLCGTAGHDSCIHTTFGVLSFDANISLPPTGQGTFSATLQPVPEPASLVMLGTGLLATVSRFRRRRSTPNAPR